MIKIQSTQEGFKLYYKEFLFFNHTQEKPIIELGKGKAKFKSHLGDFKIKEKVKEKFPLKSFELLTKTEKEIKIILKSNNLRLQLSFRVVNEYLEIIPECNDNDINRFWIKLDANASEAIYGCGEQYSELNLRGKDVPLWVEEQGVGRGSPVITGDWYTTYYPQPTFVSSNNYFCHVDATSYSRFNFVNKNYHELYIWSVPKKITLGKFNSALEVVSKLSNLLGRQPELPDWVYDGVWLGIQGGKDIVEQKVKHAIEKGVKIGGVWCQDWQGIRMTDFGKRLFWDWKFNDELYPNLPNFVKSLNQKGIKFLGYINSFLAMDGELYKEASAKGYCIKDKEGNDYQVETGNGESTIIDLSNPNTVEWIKAVIKKNMIGIGLSGWMADFGEYLPTDAILFSKENSELFHNKFPVIWAKTVYEAVKEAGKLGEIVFFTRSGYSGASKYTTSVWAGDQLVNWSMDDGLASVIPAGISLGICGIGYFHSDIGGYTTAKEFTRTKEVFMRWAELEAFSPIMRSHEGNKPQLNWHFDSDNETLEHLAKMSRIYVHLKPYFKYISKEYVEKGYPLIRALYLHYESDPEVHKIKYQYLLGRDLLVAPVYLPNIQKWKVYIPDDIWIHIWSNKEYNKGWYEVEAPIGNPPIFYVKNSQFSKLFAQIQNL